MYWYNFVTEEYEHRDTPEDFAKYIPQWPAAQNLYALYVEDMEKTPIEAAKLVLEACVGVPEKE